MATSVTTLTKNGVTYTVGDWVTYTGGGYPTISSTKSTVSFAGYQLHITALWDGTDNNQDFEYAAKPKDASGNVTNYGGGCARLSNVTSGGTPVAPTTPDSFSVSGSTFDSPVTVTVSRSYSGFSYTVSVSYTGSSISPGTIAVGSNSWSFTPSSTTLTTATSIVATITVTTKNGSTTVGSTSKNVTLSIPASYVPTLGSISVAPAETTTIPNVYVQSKTSVRVTFGSAVGNHNSTISSYKFTINGLTYSGTSSTVTSAVISTAGTYTVSATVTDSRGRTSAPKTASITVYKYAQPSASLKVFRSDPSGNEDRNGTYVTAQYAGSISYIGNKQTTQVFKIQYSTNNSTWEDFYVPTATTDATAQTISVGGTRTDTITDGFVVDNKYYFRMLVQDSYTPTTANRIVQPAFTLINFNASGKGVGVGQVSTGNRFECALPTFINSSVEINLPTASGIEIYAETTPYIDFHFGGSDPTIDYTSRIIEKASGVLNLISPNGLQVNGKTLDDIVKVVAVDADNVSVAAGAVGSVDISYTTPTGYKKIGILSTDVVNATTSGTNSSLINVYTVNHTSVTGKVTPWFKNTGTSAAKVHIWVNILFLKTY